MPFLRASRATLLEVARAAFIQGMQVAAAISIVVAIGVAVLAMVVLRDVKPSAGFQAGEEAEAAATVDHEPARGPGRTGADSPAAPALTTAPLFEA